MTTFDERFAERGAPRLFDNFGESVVYKPHGGAPRTITAMVTRNPPEAVPGLEKAATPLLILEVYGNRTTGILASELKDQVRRGKVDVPEHSGGSSREWLIYEFLGDTGGMVRFEVR